MTLVSLILILVSVALSAGAQCVLKYAMTSPSVQAALQSQFMAERIIGVAFNPFVLAGLAAYGFGAIVWLLVLARTPLSTAFPFTALAILISVLAGAFLFREPIDLYKIIATVLILSGILVLTLSHLSSRAH